MTKHNIILNIIEGWEKKFYGKQIGKIYEELSEAVLEFLKLLKSGNKILDLGCGDVALFPSEKPRLSHPKDVMANILSL